MTEQPDTAELRALITKNGPPLSPMLIFTLLDALDDARGARDYWRNRNIDLKRQEATNAALLAGAYEVSRKALDRAEAAEAEALRQAENADAFEVELNETHREWRAAEADLRLSQAAEQNRSEQADAAEARIAAARSIPAYSCSPNLIEPGTPVVLLRDLDRALTEGTGQ